MHGHMKLKQIVVWYVALTYTEFFIFGTGTRTIYLVGFTDGLQLGTKDNRELKYQEINHIFFYRRGNYEIPIRQGDQTSPI
jgi:hypothetical protein